MYRRANTASSVINVNLPDGDVLVNVETIPKNLANDDKLTTCNPKSIGNNAETMMMAANKDGASSIRKRAVKSARQVRQMRKKASVTSRSKDQPLQSRSNQLELALAIVEGDLATVDDIFQAYTALYGLEAACNRILTFRYDLDPRTWAITIAQTSGKQ